MDLAWKDKDPPGMIAAAGFTVREVEDITNNVVQALDLDSVRREADRHELSRKPCARISATGPA